MNEKKELTKEDFIEEMTKFEQVTANEILEVLEKNKHICWCCWPSICR